MSSPFVSAACKALEALAPLRLAEKWDNVGLLLESPVPRPDARRILLTIDLTPAVAAAAVADPATALVVAYHPPIFAPLAALTLAAPLPAALLRLAAAGVAVYTPHTALDAVSGGVNDWLADGVLGGAGLRAGRVRALGAEQVGPAGQSEGGAGRLVTLDAPLALDALVRRLKAHLGVAHLHVGHARTPPAPVRTVALCAGSGAAVLAGARADALLTGELSHHAVLAALAAGAHVVLAGHTNTERGFPVLARRLAAALARDGVEAAVEVCAADRDPLAIV